MAGRKRVSASFHLPGRCVGRSKLRPSASEKAREREIKATADRETKQEIAAAHLRTARLTEERAWPSSFLMSKRVPAQIRSEGNLPVESGGLFVITPWPR